MRERYASSQQTENSSGELDVYELEFAIDDALEEVEADEYLTTLKDEEIEMLITPESESDPQLDWPESNADGTISEHDYVLRLNYRLTVAAFALDATRIHLEANVDTAKWLKLKDKLANAKSNNDMYTKVDEVIALEEIIGEFARSHGTTEAECIAARN